MTKVAIGIPCFNEEKYIAGTVLSALQQLDDFSDLEIIVVDNKSTDSSVSKIESVLDALKPAQRHVSVVEQKAHVNAEQNFWAAFDHTDSEFFMWLGAHDQLSKGYVNRAVNHSTACPETALFCGGHKGLTVTGDLFEQEVKYDFSQANPVDRYLQSIAQLTNCYVFHSMFRRTQLVGIDRAGVTGGDHIIISHLLWHGTLHQSNDCFYLRRYFSSDDRATKTAKGAYPHGRNNIDFYDAYLRNLRQLVQPLPDLVGEAVISQASALLIKRFGLPFVTA